MIWGKTDTLIIIFLGKKLIKYIKENPVNRSIVKCDQSGQY